MNKLFVMQAAMTLSTAALAQEAAKPAKEDVTPMMVSFTDLKWTELPERKGMQFAVLSGDPKEGGIHADAQGPRRNRQPAAYT